MKDILTLAAGLLLASSHCPAAETGAVFIWTNATANVGQYCLNPWTTALMNQAMAKLERFRKMARPVTLEDFLGSKPRQVRLISWEEDVNQASALVRDLLHSIILRPGRQGPTCGGITWAEGTRRHCPGFSRIRRRSNGDSRKRWQPPILWGWRGHVLVASLGCVFPARGAGGG